MRLAFFDDYRLGALGGDAVVPLDGLVPGAGPRRPQDVIEHVVRHWAELAPQVEAALRSGPRLPLASVRLRAPVPRPLQLLCAVRNYREGPDAPPPELNYFLKSPLSVIGPGDTVELPPDEAVTVFQYESELAVVIGREARDVDAADAMDVVFGYTCFIDVSARQPDSTFYKRKSHRTFGPMGPVLVTKDEIADPHDLRVRFWVNGDLRQEFSTRDMANRIDQLISYASRVSTLQPGDVIATGTHHKGLGPLRDGDEAAIEIDGIGRLAVHVRDPLKRPFDDDDAQKVRKFRQVEA